MGRGDGREGEASNMDNLIEQLDAARNELAAASRKVSRLQDMHREQVVIPAMRAKVGTCYRWRRAVGSGDGRHYGRIAYVVGDRYVIAVAHRSLEGRAQFELWEVAGDVEDGDVPHDYRPISAAAYAEAVGPLLAEMVAAVGLDASEGKGE